jgi:pimeloyl-ACP methyl ester carboxylesterase
MAYVELDGVNTWYAEEGDGEALVLLHGTLVDGRFFASNLAPLRERFRILSPDQRGHGRTPDVAGPITYDLMAMDMTAFLEVVVGGSAHLVGHSAGAFVATLIALRRPDLVRRLVLVSGGFHRDGILPEALGGDVDGAVRSYGKSYGEVSPDGAGHFPVVVRKILEMDAREPTLTQAELGGISSRALVMFGDDDVVNLQHMISTYEGIPNAELAIVPGTSHFLLQEKPELCNAIIFDFLTKPPVATIAPIRRAGATH